MKIKIIYENRNVEELEGEQIDFRFGSKDFLIDLETLKGFYGVKTIQIIKGE